MWLKAGICIPEPTTCLQVVDEHHSPAGTVVEAIINHEILTTT